MYSAKEFAERVGIYDPNDKSKRWKELLRYYRSEGLLVPERTGEGVSNNMCLYGEEDLRRMEQIMIYRRLGYSIKKIKELLNDGDYDSMRALERAAGDLNKQIGHLKNLLLLARVSQALGTSFFNLGHISSDEDIDSLAETVRRDPTFRKQQQQLAGMSEAEMQFYRFREEAVIREFQDFLVGLPEEVSEREFYIEAKGLLAKYLSLSSELAGPISPVMLFYSASVLFEDNDIRAHIADVADEDTVEAFAGTMMAMWSEVAIVDIGPAIKRLSGLSKEASREELALKVDELKASIARYTTTDYQRFLAERGVSLCGEPVSESIHEVGIQALSLLQKLLEGEEVIEALELDRSVLPRKEDFEFAIALLVEDGTREEEV